MPREAYDATVAWIRSLPKYSPGTRPECATLPWSVTWGEYAGLNRLQGRCGSCYVFAPVGLLEIQRGIDCCDPAIRAEMERCDCAPGFAPGECGGCPYAPGDPGKLDLSEQVALECSEDGFLKGCCGGEAAKVVEFLADVGTTYEAIEPYEFLGPDPWYRDPFPNVCPLLDRGDDLATPAREPYNRVCDLEDRVSAYPALYPPLDFFRVVRVPPEDGGAPSAAFSIEGLTPTRPGPESRGYLPLLRTLCEGYVVALLVPGHVVVIVGYEAYRGLSTDNVRLIIRESGGGRASEFVRDSFVGRESGYWGSVASDRVFFIRRTIMERGCPQDWLADNPASNDADGDTILNRDDVCLYTPNARTLWIDGFWRAAGPDDDGDYWPEDGPALSDRGCDYCPGIAESEKCDRDGDRIANVCDSCPLHGTDFRGGPSFCPGCRDAKRWGVSDGDWIASECPSDPDGDGRCSGVAGEVEMDGVMRWRACDNCEADWNFDQADHDLPRADGIGNVCDNCPHHTNPDQGNSDPDEFGFPDRFGDACDLCPWRHEEYAGQDDLRAGLGGEATDRDGDGIGNRCDNCADEPNKDQVNCNEADERSAWAGDPREFVGTGDACDSYPCVDLCTERAGFDGAVRVPFSCRVSPIDTEWTCTDEEPLTAEFCAVGANDDLTDPPLPNPAYKSGMDFPTAVRGCWCSPTERPDGICETPLICPPGGIAGGRWEPIDYPGGRAEIPPTYSYRPLYSAMPGFGRQGERYSLGENYAVYYGAAGRRGAQEWNWMTQFGGDRKWIQMWFKPESEAWFPGYEERDGNTYTSWVDAGSAPSPGPLPVPPGVSLAPVIRGVVFGRRIEWPRQPFADLIWKHICRVALDCPWPDWFFFDQRGPRVGGLLVGVWDAARNIAGRLWGSNVVPGEVFDVVSPSIAFAFDAAGDPNRYWLFGGLDAAGEPTDEMWGGRRAAIAMNGEKTYSDGEQDGDGQIAPVMPDGTQNIFELSRIPAAQPWPGRRVGATLVCSGVGIVAGKTCDGLCPKVEVAFASSTTSGAVAEDAGVLTLVGGIGPDGPLDDIWMYGQQTQQIVAPAAPLDGPGLRSPVGGASGSCREPRSEDWRIPAPHRSAGRCGSSVASRGSGRPPGCGASRSIPAPPRRSGRPRRGRRRA
ncbi:MAG: hypothetical protein QME96_09375 [Myxococcota bacterium]|nr:hypothetical protein [Myxococcota bacterium]